MTVATLQSRQDDGYETATWAMTANQTGNPMNAGRIPGIKTVQITGTFGAATMKIEGSMDGVTYVTLHSLDFDTGDYTALSAVAVNTLSAIVENPRYIRPVQSNSAASLTVIIGGNSRL